MLSKLKTCKKYEFLFERRFCSNFSSFLFYRACVKVYQISVDPDGVHAILKLTLRFTRDYLLAKLFPEKRGVYVMLCLKQEINLVGLVALATLIFRHDNKAPSTLKADIERVSYGVIYFLFNFFFPFY